MRKRDELTREHTCMQHAHPEEMVFVLLSRDAAAPIAIRAWVATRLRLGKNTETDEQIVEALACADTMEKEADRWKSEVRPTVIHASHSFDWPIVTDAAKQIERIASDSAYVEPEDVVKHRSYAVLVREQMERITKALHIKETP